MSRDIEFWVNCVRYRNRADAYKRIDEMDINRIRTHMIDLYSAYEGENEYVAKKSDSEIRQEVKNIADLIYSDTMETSSPGVCIMHAGKDLFIFAGGYTGGGETPSDEFDAIAHLNDLGMDEDFNEQSFTFLTGKSV